MREIKDTKRIEQIYQTVQHCFRLRPPVLRLLQFEKEELLNHPDIRAFLSQMMEVDMIPDIAYGLSLRDVAKTFAGEIKPEEAQMLDIALANF